MNSNNSFSDGFHDVRWHRSRSALNEAILELAATKPVNALTAHEVAVEAGVNRSTFYKHAKNPAELLQSALSEDLIKIREEMLQNILEGTPRIAIRRASTDLLLHVTVHRSIYRSALGQSEDCGLNKLLSDYIEQTLLIIFKRGFVALPFVDDAHATGALFAAQFIARGTLGAIDAWLNESQELVVEKFFDRIDYLLPTWWPQS